MVIYLRKAPSAEVTSPAIFMPRADNLLYTKKIPCNIRAKRKVLLNLILSEVNLSSLINNSTQSFDTYFLFLRLYLIYIKLNYSSGNSSWVFLRNLELIYRFIKISFAPGCNPLITQRKQVHGGSILLIFKRNLELTAKFKLHFHLYFKN